MGPFRVAAIGVIADRFGTMSTLLGPLSTETALHPSIIPPPVQ